jgi:site-specific DNA recombinase
MTVTAIGYVRVSTDEQALEGVSIEEQSEKIRQYAALYDIELVDIVIDAGVSAKNMDRPSLQRALDALENGEAGALLVAKLDRLTRSVVNLGQLIDGYFNKAAAFLTSALLVSQDEDGA